MNYICSLYYSAIQILLKNNLRCFLFLSLAFSTSILNAQERTLEIDSLLNILNIISSPSPEVKRADGADTILVNTLNQLAYEYINLGNYEEALPYIQKALKKATDINYSKAIALAFNRMGIIYLYQGNYEKALNSLQQALIIYEKIGDKKGISGLYFRIGGVYTSEGNYRKAINNFLKSLKIGEEIKDERSIAEAYNSIGIIYFYQRNNGKALENYAKSLKFFEVVGDKKRIAGVHNNIGIVYGSSKDYKKALENQLIALKIREETGDRRGIALSQCNIGNIYLLEGNCQKALEYQLKSLKIEKEMHHKQGVALEYLNVGVIYLKLGKLEIATDYFTKAMIGLKEIGHKDGIKEVYSSMSELYEKKGDYKQAFEYHKLYSDIKDTLLNEESSRQITEMNTKYESERKEKDIQLLTKDKELQVAEIGRQKLIRNGFVGGLAIAMLLAFVLLNRFQVTRKQKGIIEYQNSQIVESINYSKRIQDALLPSIESMQQAIPSLFVFYEPKNIVSGDFYFFKEFENYLLLACVDCTGHGVPGGFMSTLGSLLLDKIANDENLKPSEILIKLSDEIIRVLHQQDGGEIQDGMDLSVCLIDRHNRQIEFSGARNGIIVVTNNEAKRYKASPLPVGGNYMKKGAPIERNFQTQTISLNANDWVYMYTDGFIEQIGGAENIPMNYEQFEKQLIHLSNMMIADSKIELLQSEFEKWKAINEQVDDILILGFRLI
jgi:tetratricopeptide (TPR) repeat protein